MIFSRKQFEKNAPKYVKKLLNESHREALDGLEVTFDDEGYGTIELYEVDGEEFSIYPIAHDWCE